MSPMTEVRKPPYTEAVRKALEWVGHDSAAADLLFLEAWEMRPTANLGSALRASQIRRANPLLAAEIGKELKAKP